MTKILTFSRTFPAFHPKKGQKTYFVEKFWNSFNLETPDQNYLKCFSDEIKLTLNKKIHSSHIDNFFLFINQHQRENLGAKHHTIRSGNKWKVGDMFSPRVWSGKPYNSPQITIAPDIRVEKVWDFEMAGMWLYINEQTLLDPQIQKVCKNDGLDFDDFLDWFDFPGNFTGQIICWNKNIEY